MPMTRNPDGIEKPVDEALAEAMYRVLSDPILARRLAANGPATAAAFTWERAVDRFETAIADLGDPNGG